MSLSICWFWLLAWCFHVLFLCYYRTSLRKWGGYLNSATRCILLILSRKTSCYWQNVNSNGIVWHTTAVVEILWDPEEVIWYRFNEKSLWKNAMVPLFLYLEESKTSSGISHFCVFKENCLSPVTTRGTALHALLLSSSYKTFSKGLEGPDPVYCFCSSSFLLRPAVLLL